MKPTTGAHKLDHNNKGGFSLFGGIYSLCERIHTYASDGGRRTFIFLMFTGLFIYVLLFATIHNRSQSDLEKNTPERYNLLIRFWKDRGYFKHGGLWVWTTDKNAQNYWDPPKADEPVKKIYRSYPMGHIMFGNIAERIYMCITGKFSNALMKYHNQFFVLLSSALLGLLGYRLAKKAEMAPLQTMLTALSCQLVYQTFSVNLFYFWEVYPSTIAVPFLLIFILLLEEIFNKENPPRSKLLYAAICNFFAFYIDPPTVGLFFIFLALIWILLGDRGSFKKNWHKITIYPAICGMVIFAAQLVTVKINFPNAELIGSGFWFRTGLDGSTIYYEDHWALLKSSTRFLDWRFLFFGGVFGFVAFISKFHIYIKNNYVAVVISSLLCLYLPVAFVISQGVIIHPYFFDAYLAMPMILLFFCLLPIILTRMSERWNGFILLFSIIAFCYCFVQLRAFMILYPIIQ